jgi:hypothetical protein
MPVIALNLSALAVAALFYLYRDGYVAGLRREKMLRERVAYLLWNVAQVA